MARLRAQLCMGWDVLVLTILPSPFEWLTAAA